MYSLHRIKPDTSSCICSSNYYLATYLINNHGYHALTIKRSNTAKDDKDFIPQIYLPL
jgi:hypothetical protein